MADPPPRGLHDRPNLPGPRPHEAPPTASARIARHLGMPSPVFATYCRNAPHTRVAPSDAASRQPRILETSKAITRPPTQNRGPPFLPPPAKATKLLARLRVTSPTPALDPHNPARAPSRDECIKEVRAEGGPPFCGRQKRKAPPGSSSPGRRFRLGVRAQKKAREVRVRALRFSPSQTPVLNRGVGRLRGSNAVGGAEVSGRARGRQKERPVGSCRRRATGYLRDAPLLARSRRGVAGLAGS
jgi:hypothetical protein